MWPIVQANRSSQGKGNGCKGTVPSAIRSGNPWVRRCSAPLFFGSPTTSCLWNTSQAENDNKNLKGEERIPLKNWLDIYIYICIYVLGMLHACRERAPRPRLSWNCCRQTGRDKTNPLSPLRSTQTAGRASGEFNFRTLVEWISVENGYGPLCLSHGFQPILGWARILWKTHTGPFSYIGLGVGLLTHRLGWRSTVLHALGLPRPTALGSPQWMIRMFTWNPWMSYILVVEPSERSSFPIKPRVIWVPGICMMYDCMCEWCKY